MASQAAPVGRRERRKQEVRDRILLAAEALFLRQGFDATTVDQIADEADVAQKTFFNHFPTKQSVFEAFADARISHFQEVVAGERGREGSTAVRLERVFVELADRVTAMAELARDLVLHMMRASNGDGDPASQQLSTLHDAIGTLLVDGQAQGDVRDDYDVAFLADLVVGAYCMIMIQWAKAPDYPMRSRLQETARFLGDAISPSGASR